MDTSTPSQPSEKVSTSPPLRMTHGRVTPPPNPQPLCAPSTPHGQGPEPQLEIHGEGSTFPGQKASQSRQFRHSDLETMRKEVARYTADIPVLTLNDFRSHLLPHSLSEEQVKEVVEDVGVDFIKLLIKQQRSFHGKVNAKEPSFFLHLKEILEKVGQVGRGLGLKQTGRVDYSPDSTPIGCEKTGSTKPDCKIVLCEPTFGEQYKGKTLLCDIFGELELKKSSKPQDVHDNHMKILWNLRLLLQDDPCRRFVYGITIENTNTRLWFACMSGIFVSEPFDYMEQTEVLLDVFARLLFSSRTELGWDDSIQRIAPQVYKIRVGDKWYTTTKKLCDISAEEIEGRATRVWEAESEDKTRVVVKDVWLDETRRPEHELIKEILEKNDDEEALEVVRDFLFTVIDFERVKLGNEEDTTKGTILRGLRLRDDCKFLRIDADPFFYIPIETCGTPPATGISRKRVTMVSKLGRRRIQYRYHYRIVFKEVATPLHSVDSLYNVFASCQDAMFTIWFLAKYGYVHRDISDGNIYQYKGKGIVGDLEYMKRFSEDGASDMRTGTVGYWALEVEKGKYIFLPQRGAAYSEKEPDVKGFKKARAHVEHSPVRKSTISNINPQAFYHNPIHDAESLWWICVEKVLTKQVFVDGVPLVDEARFGLQWRTASHLFPSASEAYQRESFLRDKTVFDECMGILDPRMAGIVDALDAIREQLISMYEATEAKAPFITGDGYSSKPLYSLVDLFVRLASAAKGMGLKDFDEEWIKDATGFNGTNSNSIKRKLTVEIVYHPSTRRRTNPSNRSRQDPLVNDDPPSPLPQQDDG